MTSLDARLSAQRMLSVLALSGQSTLDVSWSWRFHVSDEPSSCAARSAISTSARVGSCGASRAHVAGGGTESIADPFSRRSASAKSDRTSASVARWWRRPQTP
jgi:hypothetical protein